MRRVCLLPLLPSKHGEADVGDEQGRKRAQAPRQHQIVYAQERIGLIHGWAS